MHASVSPTEPPRAAAPGAVDSSPDAVTANLLLLLKHVLVSTNRDFFSAIERLGITFTQMKCLHILGEAEEPVAVNALSDAIGLSGPAVSRAVDGLVQRGEVKREEDARDRRSKLVTLTPRGRRTFERLAAVRFAGVKGFVADLTDEERQALAAGIAPLSVRFER